MANISFPSSNDFSDYDLTSGDAGGGGGGNKTLDPSAPPEILEHKDVIEKVAAEKGIDPNLIAAMIWAESRGNPNEKSDNPDPEVGEDKGLMQVSDTTASENGLDGLDLTKPDNQILAGVTEIANKINAAGGDIEQALKDYVGGDGVDPDYVTNVMGFYKQLSGGGGMSDEDPAGG